jgi:Ca-activated chloride channel family protein
MRLFPVALLTAIVALAAPARAESGRFEFADDIRMLNCEPASTIPCFRMKLNTVDARGNPIAPSMPTSQDLTKVLKVSVDGVPIEPFYAVATQGGQQAAVKGRVVLLVMDISGSMKAAAGPGATRWDAARAAALEFLSSFQPGIDRIAIVPFASKNVEIGIRAAKFATTVEEAQRQVNSLPPPQADGNTALYSAVDFGIDVLAAEAEKSHGDAEVLLVVMTDGKNDLHADDDSGLLEGEDGLNLVASKVQRADFQIITVGFGNPSEIDTAALQKLGTRSYVVSDAKELKRVFNLARTLLLDRIQATFASPFKDRASLAGRSIRIKASMALPDGSTFDSGEFVWAAPQMATPTYEGKCDPAEMKALITKPVGPISNLSLFRPVLVFVGIGLMLLILWFGVPRLIWADQYRRDFPPAPQQRWSAKAAPVQGETAFDKKAPPGFGGRGQAPERRPMDATVYQPRTDSGTRTRLN